MAAGESGVHEAVPVPREAEMAERRLRAALTEVGFDVERDFTVFHPDVTSSGQGFVSVGRLSVTTADRLAEILETTAAVIGDPRAAAVLSADGGESGAANNRHSGGGVSC
jgi:hypothetical protein